MVISTYTYSRSVRTSLKVARTSNILSKIAVSSRPQYHSNLKLKYIYIIYILINQNALRPIFSFIGLGTVPQIAWHGRFEMTIDCRHTSSKI